MRKSGILMHITSLPGKYGIGTMGASAFEFVDFLSEAGQRSWQLLPLNPTGYGDSPYQSCSAYAGNHYLIDFDLLRQQGLLEEADYAGIVWAETDSAVDFGKQYHNKLAVLRKAFARFEADAAFEAFLEENASWLADYALFMAIKDANGGAPWYEWPKELKFRRKPSLEKARRELAEQIRFYSFVQYLFRQQWSALRAYAHSKDIELIGDVPIYVPLDSVEVWTEPKLWQLDKTLTPTSVAGCPPDAFSEDGQLWGNPLYRWDVMKKDGYAWWLRRLGEAGSWYDVIRLDHFRGFEAYWSIPYGQPTAKNGEWVKGPGMDFIRTLKEQLPGIRFIAEDLGFLTQEVLDLRDGSGYPGMKILEFAFDSREPSDYLPHSYIPNTVCYTGTHDNMTMRQWFDTAAPEAVEYAREYMGLSRAEGYVWGAIRTAMASVSDLCIVQMQDYLGLGAEARMNFPGTLGSNWTWRIRADYGSKALIKRIRTVTRMFGRAKEEPAEIKTATNSGEAAVEIGE